MGVAAVDDQVLRGGVAGLGGGGQEDGYPRTILDKSDRPAFVLSVGPGEFPFWPKTSLVTFKDSRLAFVGDMCKHRKQDFNTTMGSFHMQKMDNSVEASIETKKVWSTPELQKIDIEQITATGPGVAPDTTTALS